MARTTKGRLFTRRTKQDGAVYWLDYSVNGERFRQKLTDDDDNPITTKSKAKIAADRVLRPYMARHDADRRRMAADALRTAEETAEKAEEQARDRLRLAAAWDAYVGAKTRPRSGEGTLKQYGFQWGAFVRWMAENHPGTRNAGEVTPAMAEEYAGYLEDVRGLAFGPAPRVVESVQRDLRGDVL